MSPEILCSKRHKEFMWACFMFFFVGGSDPWGLKSDPTFKFKFNPDPDANTVSENFTLLLLRNTRIDNFGHFYWRMG